ncbi:MAG: acetyl-CoA carboxylase biotin carboxyl carrier protein subunit [Bacteroidetes bacterium]|nr:MAG: acetyl-CoA carboxylase biotin carboxyl carrier protein subunit [Bacteroidota bacterium]
MAKTTEKPVEAKRSPYKSLAVESIKYRTKLTTKYLKRKAYAPVDERKITAFIPGTIKKIFVKEGNRIKEGDKLLIFEAMKMNNSILAPVDGIIEKVNVKVGDKVNKQLVLIDIK